MKLHILDTDIMTLYQAGHSKVVERVDACMPRELAITVISVEEELTGWYTKLRRAKKREDLARAYQRLTEAVSFLSGARILSFTETAIMRYEDLRKSHRKHGKNDLRIAAIALENGGTLITRNTIDFKEIPGLKIDDWSK